MATIIYEPQDTRFGDLGAAIGQGLAEVGKSFGERRKAQRKAAALKALLEGNKSQTEIQQSILSDPNFADDPQSAIQIAGAMYAAREQDKSGQRAKVVLDALYNTNKDAFKGVDPSTFQDLNPDQAITLADKMVEAFTERQRVANEQRRTDIAAGEATETARYHKASIGAQYAQIQASKEERLATLKQDQEQFKSTYDLQLKRHDLDERQFALETLKTEHGLSNEDARLALDKATVDLKKEGVTLDRERLVQDAVQFQEKVKLEREKNAADLAQAEAQANFEREKFGETQRHNLATENKTEGGVAAAAAAATAERLSVSPDVAAQINKVEPQVINNVVGQYKGVYSNGELAFTNDALPSDKAKANIALTVASGNLAATKGDPGKAIARSSAAAEEIYAEIERNGIKLSDEQVPGYVTQLTSDLRAKGYMVSSYEVAQIFDMVEAAVGREQQVK